MKKKWSTAEKGLLVLGKKPEQLENKVYISLTRGEGLNFFQLFINQVLTLLVMNQMRKTPGLLYAELKGELKNWKGSGQTMTVWDGKTMPKFRNNRSHGFSMKFFAWVIHRKNTQTYYLTYPTSGKIPNVNEATEMLKTHGKFFDGGKLTRLASPPKAET